MSEQKPSHEVKGIVRRAPRQDCVEAQIWGRLPKQFYSIEGPQEHSDLFLFYLTFISLGKSVKNKLLFTMTSYWGTVG